jgi:hypothetical protein
VDVPDDVVWLLNDQRQKWVGDYQLVIVVCVDCPPLFVIGNLTIFFLLILLGELAVFLLSHLILLIRDASNIQISITRIHHALSLSSFNLCVCVTVTVTVAVAVAV